MTIPAECNNLIKYVSYNAQQGENNFQNGVVNLFFFK